MSIDVQHSADSDTLLLWTGAPADDAEEVAEGVFVDFDADGNVVGIRLSAPPSSCGLCSTPLPPTTSPEESVRRWMTMRWR